MATPRLCLSLQSVTHTLSRISYPILKMSAIGGENFYQNLMDEYSFVRRGGGGGDENVIDNMAETNNQSSLPITLDNVDIFTTIDPPLLASPPPSRQLVSPPPPPLNNNPNNLSDFQRPSVVPTMTLPPQISSSLPPNSLSPQNETYIRQQQQIANSSLVSPIQNTSSANSRRKIDAKGFKRDIIKYMYSRDNCNFMKTCFKDVAELESTDDETLLHKFQLGILLDSSIVKSNSDRVFAGHVYTFYDILLNEIKEFCTPDVRPYLEAFIENAKKERIDLMNDPNLSLICSLMNQNDLTEMLKTLKITESVSTKALRNSGQNLLFLVTILASKKVLIPYVTEKFNLKREYNKEPISFPETKSTPVGVPHFNLPNTVRMATVEQTLPSNDITVLDDTSMNNENGPPNSKRFKKK
jgi:hypothetical protein